MFQEIKFNNELSIYQTSLNDIDNKSLAIDLELNCNILNAPPSNKNEPGIQSNIHIISKNISEIRNRVTNEIIKFANLEDNAAFIYTDWVYISDNKNLISHYHNHNHGFNHIHTIEKPKWTLVYYVEMPNNLLETEGLLHFKSKNGEEFSILPQVGQLVLFNADILHRPGLNKHSTNRRIVYASNIAILYKNKEYIKREKSLF